MNLLQSIKDHALSIGFDACGAARCRPMPEKMSILGNWIGQGLHAGMAYIEKYPESRRDPSALCPGAKSVIVCLASYKTDRVPSEGIPQIAAYARFDDYHYILKKRLIDLLDRIREMVPGCDGRVFVDSGPVLEKSWAVETGLGWQGRHSLLIHPELGSMCFIGTILTSLELDTYDTPYTENRCGSCRKCIESCPVGAIREDGLIDCRHCLSYQTIENHAPIPDELLPGLGDRLFGCDTCQDVCPWNSKTAANHPPFFQPEENRFRVTAEQWLEMGSGEFKRRFGHTPLARAGLKKIKSTLKQKNSLK